MLFFKQNSWKYRKGERNSFQQHISFKTNGDYPFCIFCLLHGVNAADHHDPKGDSWVMFYFLDRNALRIFSLPSRAILIHMAGETRAGSILIYFSKSRDTTPRPPATIGITIHSQSHIRPSSVLSPLYLEIFSCSFWATFMSFGQDMSIM